VLARVQKGLERLYRIETELEVDDYVIDESDRDDAGVNRAPREQLLVREDADGLEMGLYVDRRALAVLDESDPSSAGLHEGNFGEFLLVVEGVSHFVYLAWRAQRARAVSGLELELQGEIDKYVTCLLTGAEGEARPELRSAALRRRLFEGFEWEDGLDADEQVRYRVANDQAARYAHSLERRFVARGRVADMLDELRRFWRLSLERKLDVCRAA
jgi:hypothetical protein